MSKYEYLYEGILRRHRDIINLREKEAIFPYDVYFQIYGNQANILKEQLDTSIFILDCFLEEKKELEESIYGQKGFFECVVHYFSGPKKEASLKRIVELNDKIVEYTKMCEDQEKQIDNVLNKQRKFGIGTILNYNISSQICVLEREIENICTIIILAELLNKRLGRRIDVDALKNVINVIGIDKYKEIYGLMGGYDIHMPSKKYSNKRCRH